MNRLLSRLLATCFVAFTLGSVSLPVFADTVFTPTSGREELDFQNDRRDGQTRDTYADDSFMSSVEGSFSSWFGNTFSYFRASTTGERGAFALIINIARDVKNIFVLIAIIYLVISVLRIFFWGGDDEAIKKWRNSIMFTTIGIVVMQAAFVVVDTLYNKNVNGFASMIFLDKIVYPFVHLLEMLASFAFLAMAFYAFFKIVTAGGDDEKVKAGKQTIISALIGFIIMKLPALIVKGIYGEASCDTPLLFSVCRIKDPNLSGTISIMTNVINYINGFLAIVIVLLVLYAGWLVLSSGGDEEKIKKAKNILIYIVIGVVLLVSSYLLFNFFVLKDA